MKVKTNDSKESRCQNNKPYYGKMNGVVMGQMKARIWKWRQGETKARKHKQMGYAHMLSGTGFWILPLAVRHYCLTLLVKNVTDENGAPDQVLFSIICNRPWTSCHVLHWTQIGFLLWGKPKTKWVSFVYCGLNDPIRINEQMTFSLKVMYMIL